MEDKESVKLKIAAGGSTLCKISAMKARLRLALALLVTLSATAAARAIAAPPPILENEVMRLELSTGDGAIRVLHKPAALDWRQQVAPGFKVVPGTLQVSSQSISCRVSGPGETCELTIRLATGGSAAFDLTVSIAGDKYTEQPLYPFHFIPPEKTGWFYVQNTSGEGLLMPLDRPDEIIDLYGWSGSQPWWGLTDLSRGLLVRLDSFRNPGSGRGGSPVYALPMKLHFEFLDHGSYVAMAKLYRDYFLAAHPDLKPLARRVSERPPVGMLKDGVYVYLWGQNPAEDLKVVADMKAAGIERGFAVFYGKHPVDRALFDGIKRLGWVPGMYQMPTGNLFRVDRHGWPNKILTGRLAPDRLRRGNNPHGWERICAKFQLPRWLEKAKSLLATLGPELFYFDTLVVQLAPCLSPDHPSTIEQNQEARLELMQKTQQLGTVVGSGEGISPTWALPGLDFFEGMMSLRPYADSHLHIPRGGYATDLGENYAQQATIVLDEKRRIPLYQLAFHDYVAGTWVWRDTNFQSRPFAWKKNLFNILYGTMPMWHINRQLWESHRADYLRAYREIASVRSRIGFARMTDHGWLKADHSVQYTDWDSGDRVIVNFSSEQYEEAGVKVDARSFAITTTPHH
ncbi:MAG TPA: glycoside hydrolase [Chthoniobacterales bacterium]|nr:glycoside hydrolase [Chthoniobacterales bacterium]